jgi:hypothetical protein
VTHSDAEIVQVTGGALGCGQLFPVLKRTVPGLGFFGSPEFGYRFALHTSDIARLPIAGRSSPRQIRNGTSAPSCPCSARRSWG